jgi:hypothetical protein
VKRCVERVTGRLQTSKKGRSNELKGIHLQDRPEQKTDTTDRQNTQEKESVRRTQEPEYRQRS